MEARIGVLCEGLLHSPYSLTEVRILFEDAIYTGTQEGVILGMQEIACEVEGSAVW